MVERSANITTVKRLLGADLVERKGLVLRVLADDGVEHHLQFPMAEANGLSDVVAIALRRTGPPSGQSIV